VQEKACVPITCTLVETKVVFLVNKILNRKDMIDISETLSKNSIEEGFEDSLETRNIMTAT
jgi:hypothetical protein